MTINAANVSEIHFHHNNSTKNLDSVEAFDSNGNSLVRVPGTPDRYGVNPANADIAAMLTAHGRETNKAVVYHKMFVFWDFARFTYAETSAALALLPMDTTVKIPHQFMIDNNYFLRTNDPTNTEFSDVSGGGQSNPGLIVTDLTLFQKSATEPAAPPSSLAYPHSGTDGWGNTNVSPWVIPSVTPPGSDDLITWIAFARATSQNGGPFIRSPFTVAPFIPGATVQYSADAVTWHSTILTTGFQRVRTASGQWSAPILLNPLDAIQDAIRGTIVFGILSHITNGDKFQITPAFDIAHINELRAYWRYLRLNPSGHGSPSEWTTQSTPWTKADLFNVANFTPDGTALTRQVGITSSFFLSSDWGARIRVGQEHPVPSTSDIYDMIFNATFTRAQGVTTGREVHWIEFPRISNTTSGLMAIEVR